MTIFQVAVEALTLAAPCMVASQPDVVCYAVLRGVGDPTVLEGMRVLPDGNSFLAKSVKCPASIGVCRGPKRTRTFWGRTWGI